MHDVNWSRYPAQPLPSEYPQWRDTPAREAYFDELERLSELSRLGCIVYIAAFLCLLAGFAMTEWLDIGLGNLLVIIGSGSQLGLIFFWIFKRIFWRIRLAFKYRIFPLKLNRPDIKKPVAEIMEKRPDFDEAEFRRYWADSESAELALEIRKNVKENWLLPDKMLYPNDCVMLLHEYKCVGDEEDFEDYLLPLISDDYYYDADETFAGLVENCLPKWLEMKKKKT